MVKEIYMKRYGKALIAMLVLVLGYFCLMSFSAVHNWHQNQNWLRSEEHKKEFQEYPESYSYSDDKGNIKEVTLTFDESVELASYFFQAGYGNEGPHERLKKMASGRYDSQDDYYSQYLANTGIVMVSLIAISGFLLFFVDQKTAFNRFLFSLPVSRRQLFLGKLFYVGLPVLAAFLVGSLLLVVTVKLGIPAPYMNASWGELFISMGTSFMTCLFAFLISCFMGTMVGNLVFGPLTYVVFMWTLIYLPQGFSQVADLISMMRHGIDYSSEDIIFGYQQMLPFDIGKNSGNWLLGIIMVFVALLCLVWAYRKYQTLSLEHDGEFLLYPESRWPIWFVMTFYSSFYMLTVFNPVWNTYLYSNLLQDSDSEVVWRYPLGSAIRTTILVLVIAATIATVLLFFGQIRRFCSEKWQAHLEKRALKGRG